MIPVRCFVDGRVAVLGLGRSGLATARALRSGGARTFVWDDSPQARARAEEEGFACLDPTRPGALDGMETLVVSPGIPHLYPSPHAAVVQALAAGVPLDNDIGLFFRSCMQGQFYNPGVRPRVVAVTGSNGKSTTAALLHHILGKAGRPTQLAGNIGRAVLDLAPLCEGEVVVLELSSYQVELARILDPDIAVLTNVTADHLDRHGGLGGYFAAKRRLFTESAPERVVVGVDEVEGRYLAAQMGESPEDDHVIRISAGQELSGPGWSVSVCGGLLVERRKGRRPVTLELGGVSSLPGCHNHQNACAAYAAARSLGLSLRVIKTGFRSFSGLPHRSQPIGEANGIRFVNDSKATNVDSAVKALGAFSRIRWICGGLAKEGGAGALAAATGNVVKAYVIGRDAATFARGLGVEAEICTTMACAVASAVDEARPGEVVLLAPAAASFDQYDNFEKRGEDFIAEVEKGLARWRIL